LTKEITYRLEPWLDQQIAMGRFGFSLAELKLAFPDQNEVATKSTIRRQIDKGKVLSIYKGYYLILPPQFAGKGMLPSNLFLDGFMKFLNRPYYLGLLNAAALHGSSHQQPQENFVITNFPVLRTTNKSGLRINYISVKAIPEDLIELKKTEAGYLKISNAALTAVDLIQFEKRIGGINRATTVITELAEVLTENSFNSELLKYSHITSLQRLGYLLEFACQKMELADALYESLISGNSNFFRIPLKSLVPAKGFSSDNRWKVIVNTEIEIDD
jgi:predicted transcriptional regulator of viral defense system